MTTSTTMTTLELQKALDLKRTHLQFYEAYGFIQPAISKNGRPIYSEKELDTLKRVLLLRRLQIPATEILKVIQSKTTLHQLLQQQLAELKEQGFAGIRGVAICEMLLEENDDFWSFDPALYEHKIEQIVEETETGFFRYQGDFLPPMFHPWRRYFARSLDLSLYALNWSFILGIGFGIDFLNRTTAERFLDTSVEILLFLLIEPLLLHFLGTTPGKAIFGLRLTSYWGGKLSYSEAFSRTFSLVWMYIPFYNYYRLWIEYKACSQGKAQTWNGDVVYTLKDQKKYRFIVYIAGCFAVWGMMILIFSYSLLPPNRGDLTVAQFAENVNYYAKFYKLSPSPYRLTQRGQWIEISEYQPNVDYTAFNRINPACIYQLEDNVVKSVSFMIESRSPKFHDSYLKDMFLFSLALAGSEEHFSILPKFPERLTDFLGSHQYQSFHFRDSNIQLNCKVETEGYVVTDYYAAPIDEAKYHYFRLEFIAEK